MTQRILKLSLLPIALNLVLTTTIQAASPNQLQDEVNECETLLTQSSFIIKRQAETIRDLDAQNEAFRKAVEQARGELSAPKAWYESPWVPGILGFVGGALLTHQVMK